LLPVRKGIVRCSHRPKSTKYARANSSEDKKAGRESSLPASTPPRNNQLAAGIRFIGSVRVNKRIDPGSSVACG
jgi:hypothetical protein